MWSIISISAGVSLERPWTAAHVRPIVGRERSIPRPKEISPENTAVPTLSQTFPRSNRSMLVIRSNNFGTDTTAPTEIRTMGSSSQEEPELAVGHKTPVQDHGRTYAKAGTAKTTELRITIPRAQSHTCAGFSDCPAIPETEQIEQPDELLLVQHRIRNKQHTAKDQPGDHDHRDDNQPTGHKESSEASASSHIIDSQQGGEEP